MCVIGLASAENFPNDCSVQDFQNFTPCRLAFLVSVGNSNDNAGGAGVLPPFEPGEYHERPETTETRPADSLAASPLDCRQRPPAHEGEAGAEGRRSVKRLLASASGL